MGILWKVRRFFTSEQLLILYRTQVRSCLEYCCHIWEGSARYQLDALDSIEHRAKRLIGNDILVETNLQTLEHRRRVACLSVFYRLHFGECADVLHDLIPPAPFHLRSTSFTAFILMSSIFLLFTRSDLLPPPLCGQLRSGTWRLE